MNIMILINWHNKKLVRRHYIKKAPEKNINDTLVQIIMALDLGSSIHSSVSLPYYLLNKKFIEEKHN